MLKDFSDYKGKVCVVTGAASGSGHQTFKLLTELGAEVYALDVNQVEGAAHYIKVNMADKKSIDEAIAQLPSKVDRLFPVAGIAGMTYRGKTFTVGELMSINYSGSRYFMETLAKRMPRGSSITCIGSFTCASWATKMELLDDLYTNANTFEKAIEWAEKHKDDPEAFDGCKGDIRAYGFTKEALAYYVKRRAFKYSQDGIRINLVNPANVNTGMTQDFKVYLEQDAAIIRTADGTDAKTSKSAADVGKTKVANPAINRMCEPVEVANVLVFLGSDMASYMAGADVYVDYGCMAGFTFGQFDMDGNVIKDE